MKHADAGFTLLEVLIALTVLALALGAVIQAAGDFTVSQAYLRDRTYAEWVAHNRLAEAQLEREWPSVGQSKGEAKFPLEGDNLPAREWRWEIQVTQTPEQDLRRLDIDVYPLDADEDDSPMATLSGFVGKPPQ